MTDSAFRLAEAPSSPRPSKVQKLEHHGQDLKQKSVEDPPMEGSTTVIEKFDFAHGPVRFYCSSGELLWGQLHTVIEGSGSQELDSGIGPHETLASGTIIQSRFRYRAKARKGAWSVKEIHIDDWHVGFACFHEGEDAVGIVSEAAKVGVDLKSRTGRVVYVNRYDWGWTHSPGVESVLPSLGLPPVDDDDDCDEYLKHLVDGRFMLLDSEGLPVLLQALKDGEKLERENLYFCKHSTSANAVVNGHGSNGSGAHRDDHNVGNGARAGTQPFGVNLSTRHPEYELGWMLWDEDELVGFVYDGEYSALDSEEKVMTVGEEVVPRARIDSEYEEDEPYSPSTGTDSTDSEPDMRYYAGSETESEAGSQATSGQTAISREVEGGEEEQGEECSSRAGPALETIQEEEEKGEPSGAKDADFVVAPPDDSKPAGSS